MMAEEQSQQNSDMVYLTDNKSQRLYMITYSNINKNIFPTRESFGRACAMAFGGNKVLYFACAEEDHKTSNNKHYHVAIKLNPSQRWKTAKDNLLKNFGVVANFASSPNGGMYAGAYRNAQNYQ